MSALSRDQTVLTSITTSTNHVWGIAEICNLLPESHTIAAQIDKALILKALDNAHSL
jgi:hypothetical protein